MTPRVRLGCALGLALWAAAAVTGCASKKHGAEAGVARVPEEAYRRGRELLEQRKLLQALDTFQGIDFSYTAGDRATYEPLVKLGLADATFYKGTNVDLIEARSLYLEFVALYSDHPSAPYALFQAAMCSLEQASHPSKDQSQTQAAFDDFRQVTTRYPDSRYAGAARDMIRRAESLLAEHEFLVGRYYMTRKRYLAASGRFRIVLERFPSYPEPEKVGYYLGLALLQMDNLEEARAYFDRVLTDYPDGEWATATRKVLAESAEQFEAGIKH